MELTVSPLCGRNYANADAACFLDDQFFANVTGGISPPMRGYCWNALTRSLLVCDPARSCVHAFRMEIDSDSHRVNVLGSGGSGFPLGSYGNAPGKFVFPAALDVNLRGDIAVADAKLDRIQVFSGSGQLLSYFGKTGAGRGKFRGVSDLKFTLQGHLAIVDSENHRVVIMTAVGGLVAVVGRHGWRPGQLMNPCALEINQNGDIFVLDGGNKRIQRFSMKGRLLAAWGGYRDPHQVIRSSAEEAEASGVDVVPAVPVPPLLSYFGGPCDLGIGANGEVIVCDAVIQQLLVFSDVGECLHVVRLSHVFDSMTPIGITLCGKLALVIMRSSATSSSTIDIGSGTPRTPADVPDAEFNSAAGFTQTCSLAVFPPSTRVPAGKIERWPVVCVERVLCFLTYQDALRIRLANRFLHRVCRSLRNAWKLFPLTSGRNAERKYNRVVRKATGLAAVHEAFEKWGLRVYKPSNRVRRHVMDFESSFCGALRSSYSAMFIFEHEEILKQLFLYHASSTFIGKAEIEREAFVEIVTQIEEVRSGLMSWQQCPAFRGDGSSNLPQLRIAGAVDDRRSQARFSPALQLVESAQQQQLGKLLRKLETL